MIKVMRLIVNVILLIFAIAVGTQLYRLHIQRNNLQARFSSVTEEIETLENENENLKNDIRYFDEPDNVAKELKAQFNYKKPGEKLLIVIPNNGD